MSPLGRYSIYCDHGLHVGHECVRCWQRRALDAEAELVALQGTITELREELAQRSGMSIMALYHEGITLRDALVSSQATIAELREELAQAQNALANSH